ncbi:hypothetical protein IL252_09495 [Halomicrobium sp. IBSBa]|uniref:hypothetical protein n=1 Tax=Halomicrobium sp. IBSBa TaxID=2778916 RepID=UPI001ABFDA8C|nr:hypothetical protein [Halomicrobium sp. IBSBa]MBO4248048.1 hypothetical protein [Halomicrobium sp. IBSBa]
MGVLETIGKHVQEHRSGMLVDLAFAVIWVTAVTLLFDLLAGPQWAYYLTMGAGVLAYYGFFWSLAAARSEGETD